MKDTIGLLQETFWAFPIMRESIRGHCSRQKSLESGLGKP